MTMKQKLKEHKKEDIKELRVYSFIAGMFAGAMCIFILLNISGKLPCIVG